MPLSILLRPTNFQREVLSRDHHACVCCRSTDVVVAHLLNQQLWSDGGFYVENGVTVCREHELELKRTNLSLETLREAARIPYALTPDHLSAEASYDHWGNQLVENGLRLRGTLFETAAAQKHLAEGGYLGDFPSVVSYPSTKHVPWSEGVQRDDKQMKPEDLMRFEGAEVVVTEKRDGENATLYAETTHARSTSSRHHPSRDWLKNFWNSFRHLIPENYRICGESLYARHSIAYSFGQEGVFFEGFSMWDEANNCLSWDETMIYFDLLGIKPVPVLYRGLYDEKAIRALYDPKRDYDTSEGYVIRLASGFHYSLFDRSVCKYVRKDHVQTDKHWMHSQIIPNI